MKTNMANFANRVLKDMSKAQNLRDAITFNNIDQKAKEAQAMKVTVTRYPMPEKVDNDYDMGSLD
jgi:hypothetical protein